MAQVVETKVTQAKVSLDLQPCRIEIIGVPCSIFARIAKEQQITARWPHWVGNRTFDAFCAARVIGTVRGLLFLVLARWTSRRVVSTSRTVKPVISPALMPVSRAIRTIQPNIGLEYDCTIA